MSRHESPDLSAFLGRMARALVRRAATGDLEALTALAETRAAMDASIRDAAQALHAAGYSWTDIGRELGVSRQAARQTYGQRVVA